MTAFYPNESLQKHGKGSYLHKETMSQYVGTWNEGEFQGGQWVLVDNTLYTSKVARRTAVASRCLGC